MLTAEQVRGLVEQGAEGADLPKAIHYRSTGPCSNHLPPFTFSLLLQIFSKKEAEKGVQFFSLIIEPF